MRDAGSQGWRHPLAQIDFDAAFTYWAFVTALFPLYLKSATGAFFILMPAVFFVGRTDRIVPLFKRGWPVLLIPGLAILSTLWSVWPGTTLYYSMQFGATVMVGVIIGIGLDRRQALNGAFAAFLTQGALTFAYGMSTGLLERHGGVGFTGLAGSKNMAADMACVGLLIAIAYLGAAISEKRPLRGLLASGLIAVNLYVTYCAMSAGAEAAVAVAILVLVRLLCSAWLPPAARIGGLGVFLAAGGGAAATQNLWYNALFNGYLKAAGKDEGLTGRSYIWGRAEVLYHQHPWLGRGYGAFWRNGDLESEAIWDRMGIANHQGFNFHNGIYELLVYLGYTGLILFGVVALICIATLFVRTMIRVSPAGCLYCGFIVYDAMRFQFEALPLSLFSHNVMMLYASFAAAFAAFGKPVSADYGPSRLFGRRGGAVPRPAGVAWRGTVR